MTEFKGGYEPASSGMLRGNGPKFRRRNVIGEEEFTRNGFPVLHMSDSYLVKRLIPDYDPKLEFQYTRNELNYLAENMLLNDPKPFNEPPYWLPVGIYMKRLKREIYTAAGTPDPSIVSGLYWRTHPNGRKVSSDEQRKKNSASFYR